jgi:hypothetical protein
MKRRRGRRRQPSPEAADPQVVARVEQLFDRLDRLASGDAQAPRPAVDQDHRAEVREVATEAAIKAGRGRLLADARRAAREVALRRFGSRVFRPTWVGLNWGQSLGTVEDRVAAAEIFDDAAMGAVVADVEPDAAADLLSGLDALESIAGGPPEQSLELALRRRPRPTRAFVALLAAGYIGPFFILLTALGPFGAVAATAIAVAVVVLVISRMAPRPASDDVETTRDSR